MIEGTVLRVVNQYEVVMDKGWQDDVDYDKKFMIYTLGEEMFDPETDESLGKVEHLKARVKPRHIQEAITTLETDETTTSYSGLGAITGMNTKQESPKSIADRPENTVDNTVHEGDLIREIESQ